MKKLKVLSLTFEERMRLLYAVDYTLATRPSAGLKDLQKKLENSLR